MHVYFPPGYAHQRSADPIIPTWADIDQFERGKWEGLPSDGGQGSVLLDKNRVRSLWGPPILVDRTPTSHRHLQSFVNTVCARKVCSSAGVNKSLFQ